MNTANMNAVVDIVENPMNVVVDIVENPMNVVIVDIVENLMNVDIVDIVENPMDVVIVVIVENLMDVGIVVIVENPVNVDMNMDVKNATITAALPYPPTMLPNMTAESSLNSKNVILLMNERSINRMSVRSQNSKSRTSNSLANTTPL
jgi:hypothetical protein